jgi:hypothetical protein
VRHVSGLLRPIFNTWFRLNHGEGIDVMSEDWDTLILFDACRYDDFSRRNSLDGEIQSRLSKAADSREFVNRNFIGRELHDTVYVTANPHYHLVEEDTFHAVDAGPISEWDSDLQCVPPEAVTEVAIQTHERFPNKRIIVHYMQPHDPPLGKTADRLREQLRLGGPQPSTSGADKDAPRIMEAVAAGEVQLDVARKAYRETIDIVLEDVERLIDHIGGRVVISADHGEMFGEQPYPILGNLYEHYRHPHTVELCQVPWFVIERGDRRKVRSDPPLGTPKVTSREVSDQLEALGYR